MLTQREVIRLVLEHKRPPYVPWSCGFTHEAAQKLQGHFGPDWETVMGNHILGLGRGIGYMEEVGNDCVKDHFGVVWDRSRDKDIGVVKNYLLPEPTLSGYTFPDPHEARFFNSIPELIERHPDRFRVFHIGFSLYERAWTLRGMENLLMDFVENPEFVHELFDRIADWNIAMAQKAMTYDIDAVYFGDDWGQQHGLQMRPAQWREFILPRLKRMYGTVRAAGKYQFIHSCGDVDEVFDDLVDAGLNCFNPFQPEVMDTAALISQYRGRLVFHGGLSTQRTLPYGSNEDVNRETERLLELGRDGAYIFSPAHAVEGDVPLENMLAFIERLQAQQGYRQVRKACSIPRS